MQSHEFSLREISRLEYDRLEEKLREDSPIKRLHRDNPIPGYVVMIVAVSLIVISAAILLTVGALIWLNPAVAAIG